MSEHPTRSEAVARARHAIDTLDKYEAESPPRCSRKDCAEAVAELMRLVPIMADWILDTIPIEAPRTVDWRCSACGQQGKHGEKCRCENPQLETRI